MLVTPDSKYLLATDADGKRLLYPLQGGDPKPITAALEANDGLLQFDPDGKSVIVGQRGVPLKLFRVTWIATAENCCVSLRLRTLAECKPFSAPA